VYAQGTSLQDSLVGILGQGPSVSAGSVKIHVTAPSMQLDGAALDSEGEEEEEEEDRPLTRQELRAKAMLRVQVFLFYCSVVFLFCFNVSFSIHCGI